MPGPHPLQILKSPEPTGAEPRSDDYLMALAAEDRSAAFGELVSRYEGKVRAFCSMLVHDEALGRDLAQEVFLKLWGSRSRFRAQGKFRPMLFTIARNHCRTSLRKKRLRSLLGLEDSVDSALHAHAAHAGANAQEQLLEEERGLLVRRALEALPEKFRLPVMLRFCDEMPYEEIAAIIGRTESATRSRVHYGLKALQLLLPAEVLP